MSERFLTVQQVAETLSVHPNTVRRWLNERRLKGVRLGGTKSGWRITESDLGEFMQNLKKAS